MLLIVIVFAEVYEKRKKFMTVSSLFKEYIWLVNTIKRARRITFAEIQEKWLDTEMSGGVEFARSTFNRHKDAIQDIFTSLPSVRQCRLCSTLSDVRV